MARTAKRYKSSEGENRGKERETFYVGIYSRLSVDLEEKKSESIENQITIIEKYIEVHNAEPDRKTNLVVQDVYIDRGVSGTSFDRAGFRRLMQDVGSRSVNCIMVKDLSRLGRDYLETGTLLEKILPFMGCRLIAVADHFDSLAEDGEENKLVIHIKNLVNDLYAKDIAKRVTMARALAAQNGAFIGGFAPYGYQVVCQNGLRKLEIQEECATVVRSLFYLFAEGKSLKQIVKELYHGQIHRISDYKKYGHVYCKQGENLHQWNETTIRGILQNESYLGRLKQCKITVRQTHPAIIEKELFKQVQERFGNQENFKEQGNRREHAEAIYHNILYCGSCGKRMHITCYQRRGKENRNYRYFCKGAYLVDERKCNKNYIRQEKITSLLKKQLQTVLAYERVTAKDLTGWNQEEYQRKIAEYKWQEERVLEACVLRKKQNGISYARYKKGEITKEEYDFFCDNRKKQDDLARKEKGELQERMERAGALAEAENRILCSIWDLEGEHELRRQLLEALVEKITVWPEGRIVIQYRFSKGESQNGEGEAGRLL